MTSGSFVWLSLAPMWSRNPIQYIALALCVLTLLVGTADAQLLGGRTEIRFSYWGSFADNQLWKQICEDFEAKNDDIRVKREWIVGNYSQKLPLLLISDTAADIILMGDEEAPTYGVRGYLEDLTPYVKQDHAELLIDDFLPLSLESFQYQNKQIGMPWDGYAVIVFYNAQLFDELGIEYPTENWTWGDFRRIAKELTRDTNGDGRLDTFGTNMGFGWLGVEPLVWSYGGRFLNEDRTKATTDDPKTIEACQLLYDMKWKDHSIAWQGEGDNVQTEVQLLTGRVGMVLAPIYNMFNLEKIPQDEAMRWNVAHIPYGPYGDRVTRLSFDGISMNSGISEEKKVLAWRFIKHVLSSDSQRLIAESGRGAPVRISDAQEYFVKGDQRRQLALDAMLYGDLTPITAKYMELRTVIHGEFSYLNTQNPDNPNAGKKTPKEALEAMIPGINKVLRDELERWGGLAAEAKEKRSPLPLLIGLVVVLVALISFALYRNREQFRLAFHSRMGRQEAFYGYLFAAPWLIHLMAFTAFPIIFSIVLSVCKWDPYDQVSAMSFIGLENFKELASDPLLIKSLYNTFVYAIWAVPLTLGASLTLAVLLNQNLKGIAFFRTTFYVPTIVGAVATSMLWFYIFDPTFGPLNGMIRQMNIFLDWTRILAFIELPEPGWLTDPNWSKPAIILMMLWGSGGGTMLIFLAGLQGIPDQLYEVADLDGAGRLRKFWNVTIPMLTPTLYFNFIMTMIGQLQIFNQAFIMVGEQGGADNALLFYVLYLYRKAFIEYEMGYASAMAWILFVIILGFTMLTIKSSALWVYYEGERD